MEGLLTSKLWVLLCEDVTDSCAHDHFMSMSLGTKATTLEWQRRKWTNPHPSQCCRAIKLKDHGIVQPLEILLWKIISPLIYKPLCADISVILTKSIFTDALDNKRLNLQQGFDRREWREVRGKEGVLSCSMELAPTLTHTWSRAEATEETLDTSYLEAEPLSSGHTPDLLS